MNPNAPEVQFVEQSGLSVETIRIIDVQTPGVFRLSEAPSQPAKLLLLGLLIMTCLCGSLYYATMTAGGSTEQGKIAVR